MQGYNIFFLFLFQNIDFGYGSNVYPRSMFFFCVCVFFNSVLRSFQDFFSSYETGQSVGGVKTEEP